MTMLTSSAPPRISPTTRPGLQAFAALLWRRRTVILVVLVLVGATIAAGLTLAPRQYTATARAAATPPPELSQSPASFADLLGTMADVAESGPLLQQVAEETGIASAESLRDRVRGSVIPGTVIIQVSVTDRDPDVAAEVANAIVAALEAHDPTNGSFLFHTTEPADPPSHFSSPNVSITILAGGALAVLLAIGAAVLADRLTRTVDDVDDLRDASGTSVLGVVPQPSQIDGVPAADPTSPEFQALRALRVGIEFASSEQPTRLLVAAPADGPDPLRGWLEVNLATTLAEVGHRVLLIDADRDTSGRGQDVRHEVLAVDGGAGFYDVLAGIAVLGDAVRPGPVAGVDVLTLGDAHSAAPSLLELGFPRLLADTVDRYDVVLVHAGAVTSAEDARIMAIHGALLLTVPAGHVHPRNLQRAAEHLRMIRIRVIGSVLLGARGQRRS